MKFKSKKGQNTAEYLLMLSIVVVGSMGVMTVFGQQVRNRLGSVTAALGGDSTKYGTAKTAAAAISEVADTRAKKAVSANGIDEKEFSSDGK